MFSTGLKQGWSAELPQGRIGGAIAQASARTGIDFSYLMNQAKIESGFNPTARARTSSATGLYQFIDQTWLSTVKKHGEAHGLGWAAQAIQQGSDGRYHVADGGVKAAILDLRNQPEAASAMAAEFASDNRDHLESDLGRPVESVDLYLAHFLGAGGASKFLRAHDSNPNGAAADMLPGAARANRNVFYDKSGAPRSFAEIRGRFAAKLGGGGAMPDRLPVQGEFMPLRMASLPASTPVRLASLSTAPQAQTGISPQYARLAYLMLAQLDG